MHSRLRNTITGDENFVAKKTGLTCYRVAVSVDNAKKALGDLPLPHWWDPSTSQNRTSVISAGDGSSRLITTYPIRNREYFNLSCILRTQESTKSSSESWNAEGDQSKMIETFQDFGEQMRLILRCVYTPPTSRVKRANISSVPQPRPKYGNCKILNPFQHGYAAAQCSLEMPRMP